MQRQTKARTRQKVKKLRAKRLQVKIFERRQRKKLEAATRRRGKTLQGIRAAEVATYIAPGFGGKLFDHKFLLGLNQRQKRKRRRSAGIKY